MVGEEGPVQPLEHRVQKHKTDAEADGKDSGFADPGRRCGRRHGRAAVQLGYALVDVEGLRHAPTPRKSLATCPTRKAYHTLKARNTTSHLRVAAYCSVNGCRQKYQ